MAIIRMTDIDSSIQRSETGTWQRTNTYEALSNIVHEDPFEVWTYFATVHEPGAEFMSAWRFANNQSDEGQALVAADIRRREPGVSGDRKIWRLITQYKDYEALQKSQDMTQGNLIQGGGSGAPGTPTIRKTNIPWDEQARWSGNFFYIEEQAVQDVDGNPVINSADQPYTEETIEEGRDVLIAECNTQFGDWGTRHQLQNSRNAAEFLGFPAGTVKLKSWVQRSIPYLYRTPANPNTPDATEGLIPYFWNRLEFHVKLGDFRQGQWSGWTSRRPDYATVQKYPAEPNLVDRYRPFEFRLENTGTNVPGSNLMLDGSGTVATDQTALTFNEFNYHPPMNFGLLPTQVQSLPKNVTVTIATP